MRARRRDAARHLRRALSTLLAARARDPQTSARPPIKVGSLLIQSDGRPGETHDPFSEVARDLSMSSIFTIEYEHTWPTECWPDNLPRTPGAHKEIWGADAGKPTGQRFLLDVPNVRDQAHA